MPLVNQAFIPLMMSLAYGGEARRIEWLFAHDWRNGDRYYIEPKERGAVLDTGPATMTDNGFQCIPATQYANYADVFSVRFATITRVKHETKEQTRHSASLIADKRRDCFTSIDPYDPEVAAKVNEFCKSNSWDPEYTLSNYTKIEDGTYYGTRAGSMGLRLDVKDGRVARVIATQLNNATETMTKITYFGFARVLSVIAENPAVPLMRYEFILEHSEIVESDQQWSQYTHFTFGRHNIKDWDRKHATERLSL
ncbi:hypothetical protein FOZ63_026389 [Perkinsus olseni]|uniref:Uncharacterized protein n=1 Tax=Perkinsus olseni TaxID=32597 RepID=A0A7J6QUK2_PEROL|nr:hypothetical protein FOZ62_025246 [Perkinsus olseni]KAF4759008.1 hypothetical protein FOZ63_026389 [Perkinsus olseni]